MVWKLFIPIYLVTVSLCASNEAAVQVNQDNILTESLSLYQVIDIAIANNPTFVSFNASLDIVKAEMLQARTWSNPEFESSWNYISGNDDVEYEIELSQPIELPMKRRLERDVLGLSEQVVSWDKLLFHIQLSAEITKAYHLVTFRDAMLSFANQNLALTRNMIAIVKKRVDAGGARQIDQTKANVEVLKADKRILYQKRLLRSAKKVLNGLCAGMLPSNFSLSEPLSDEMFQQVSDYDKDINISNHPKLRRLKVLKRQQLLELKREKISWLPDIRPTIGYERETEVESVIAGVGIEVPLWNRNKPGIAKAKAELRQIEATIHSEQLTLKQDIELARETFANSCEQILALRDLRSAANQVLASDTKLYEQGQVDLITLLDARRTVLETESQYLEAIYDAYISETELNLAKGIKGDEK